MLSYIHLRKVCTHNLKNIDIKIPKNQLTVITGVSGSGKSSLAFDTIFREGQHLYQKTLPTSQDCSLPSLSRMNSVEGLTPTVAVGQHSATFSQRSTIGTLSHLYDFLRALFAQAAIPHCPSSLQPLICFTEEKIAESIIDCFHEETVLFLSPIVRRESGELSELCSHLLQQGITRIRVDGTVYHLTEPLPPLISTGNFTIYVVIDRFRCSLEKKSRILENIKLAFSKETRQLIVATLSGSKEEMYVQGLHSPVTQSTYPTLQPEDFSFYHPKGMCEYCQGLGNCKYCHNSRLKPYPSAATIHNKTIHQLTQMSIEELRFFLSHISTDQTELWRSTAAIVNSLLKHLEFLHDIGLEYLSLDRLASSLSGGELQRVRIATQIGVPLTGITYVLDEPSIGLHHRDHYKLLSALHSLKKQGNTVIVVEHDRETILAADYIIDLGPGAGAQGGNVVAQGTVQEILNHPSSLTGAYLSSRKVVSLSPKKRLPSRHNIFIEEAYHNNLRHISVTIPLGLFVSVTGVSGSGKSSLLQQTLFPFLSNQLHKTHFPVGGHERISGFASLVGVQIVNQRPIRCSQRSTSVTYTKIFHEIRTLYAKQPISCSRGYTADHFSFNTREGTCSRCKGRGTEKISIGNFGEEWICCLQCEGKRFNADILFVTYKEKNIHQLLNMSVEESILFFQDKPSIRDKLKTLSHIGLDYLTLGQSTDTLSGGEIQRLKLARDLLCPPHGPTLYILDEPTTGLHFHDIKKLIDVFQEMVDRGHTVIVIEHHLDVIHASDWVIELGPGGGKRGGYLIATGPPSLSSPIEEREDLSFDKLAVSPHLSVCEAREKNLQAIDIDIPIGDISLLQGPSGAGKTALGIDTIYAECQRQYIQCLNFSERMQFSHQTFPKVQRISHTLPPVLISPRLQPTASIHTVGTFSTLYDSLQLLYSHEGTAFCPVTGKKICWITPQYIAQNLICCEETLSFAILVPYEIPSHDTLKEMQKNWIDEGFTRVRVNGTYYHLDEPLPAASAFPTSVDLLIDKLTNTPKYHSRLQRSLGLASKKNCAIIIALSDRDLRYSLGFGVENTRILYPPLTTETFSFLKKTGMCLSCQGTGTTDDRPCAVCSGSRLNALARSVQVSGIRIEELLLKDLITVRGYLQNIQTQSSDFTTTLQIIDTLIQLGLGNLWIHQPIHTLSKGEYTKLHVAKHLATNALNGLLYVMDHPTTGLHPSEYPLIESALQTLKCRGNTLLVIDVHPLKADHMFHLGPSIGKKGGYLLDDAPVSIPQKKKHYAYPETWLEIKIDPSSSLDALSLMIPWQKITCITGISGTGKSQLLAACAHHATLNAIPILSMKIEFPITRRSDIGTYLGLLAPLRVFFASLPMAKIHGLTEKNFSFHHRDGICATCKGTGKVSITRKFLPDFSAMCSACHGYRLHPLSLRVLYRGKHLGELLQIPLEAAYSFLPPIPQLSRWLDISRKLALTHLPLDRKFSDLSAGEGSRLILSKLLAKKASTPTLYLLDEPMYGLDYTDTTLVVPVLYSLAQQGHAVVCADQESFLMSEADWLVEMGFNKKGKRTILTVGTPEMVSHTNTPTGKHLIKILPKQ